MQNYKQLWKQTKQHDSWDHYVLAVVKAIRAKSNEDKTKLVWAILQRAFSPVVNRTKLVNGMVRWNAIAQHAWRARWVKATNPLLDTLTAEEREQFYELSEHVHQSITHRKVPEKQYCFFFVRQDISPEYQLVQNSHVALRLGAEMAKEGIPTEDLYFACIGTEDLDSLMEIYTDLLERGIRTVPFHEPDLRNGELTAIATFPIPADQKAFLKGHKRLTFN